MGVLKALKNKKKEKNSFYCLIGSLKMILGGLSPKKSFSFLYKGVK